MPYHICCFRTGNGKFQVGVLLPISKQQGELGQEAVVDISYGGDSLRVGVAIDSSFEGLGATNQSFPGLEVIGVIELYRSRKTSQLESTLPGNWGRDKIERTSSASSFLSSAFSSSEPP